VETVSAGYAAFAAAGFLALAAGFYFAARRARLFSPSGLAGGWEQIFDSITDPILILDSGCRITAANKAARGRPGAGNGNIIGRRCAEVLRYQGAAAEACPDTLIFKNAAAHTAEVTETGTGLPLLVTVSPIFDKKGRLAGAVHITRDLSGKKELEARLLQLGKMEALGRLAGGLAHEFNNILSVISSAFYMLRPALPRGGDAEEYSDAVQKAISNASNLTRHLLTLSQRQVLDLKPCDLSALAAETAQMLKKLLGERTTVRTSLAPGLAPAKADPAQINKLIMGLLAAETGGARAVDLATETVMLGNYPGAAASASAPRLFVRLRVSDSAHAIKPEDLPHVFEPYFSAGSLGLAMAYGIARQHQGWIDALESKGGTSFEVYFPASGEEERPEEQKPRQKARPQKSLKILLAEDDDDLRLLTEKALTHAGHKVWAADCAGKALDLYHQLDGDFDALVSDVVMPDKSGVELADAILKVKPDLRVVLMSGYVDDRASLESIQRKNYGFIYKPFDVDALLLKLR
jgi:PAS domain S-box-containing protein